MLEKETTGESDGSASEKTFDAEHFTASVDKLISGQPTEESTYDSLQPTTKAEENHYDSLPPRFCTCCILITNNTLVSVIIKINFRDINH